MMLQSNKYVTKLVIWLDYQTVSYFNEQIKRETGLRLAINSEIIEGIPRYITSVWKLYNASIGSESIILVSSKVVMDIQFDIGNLRKIRERFSTEVVWMDSAIPSGLKNELIEYKLPFINLNGEYYLPFIGVHVRNQIDTGNYMDRKYLSLAATNLLTVFIYKTILDSKYSRWFAGGKTLLDDIGYFANINNRMAMSRAITELQDNRIIVSNNALTHKSFRLNDLGLELFDKNNEIMKSPIIKRYRMPNDFLMESVQVTKSGLTALSEVTMIDRGRSQSFAINNKKLKDNRNLVMANENSPLILEAWNRDPKLGGLFTKIIGKSSFNNIPDPIGLFLSFRGNNDERVSGELSDYVYHSLRKNAK